MFTRVSGRRSFDSHESTRVSALSTVEKYFAHLWGGLDGHGCMLRMICEVAKTPFHADGLVGEAINAMLIPAHVLEKVPTFGESDYLTAQRKGQYLGDCAEYHSKCSMSFFEVIDCFPIEITASKPHVCIYTV